MISWSFEEVEGRIVKITLGIFFPSKTAVGIPIEKYFIIFGARFQWKNWNGCLFLRI
jgi:hypothetical protein